VPLTIEEQSCEQSDGTSGSWVVKNEETGEVESCHKSKKKATISAGFRSGEIEKEED
jgi:hypothetical protein